jgi:4-amino-4-deoxy-L-arabinose transferase-like glycosyltransferase
MTALTLAICAAWILPGLIGHDPWKPDEAYTFGLVHHVLQGGGWLVPMLAGEPFVEKPPIFVLTAALFAKLFAWVLAPHDGARLAAGFFIAIAFAFTAAAGRELFGKERGWVATLVLLGSLGLLVRAHQLITDTAQLAGFAIGTYGLALCIRRPLAGGVWLGTGAGLGFMAKGLLAPGILGLTGIALFVACRAWRTRTCLAAYAIAFLALAPWITIWPVLLYQSSAELFYEWFWTNNFGRFLGTAALGPRAQPMHYLGILPWYAWPAWPLALWVLWGTRVSGFRRPAIELPVMLFLVAFAVLSVSADAREVYAMPMLIPLALLATPALGTLRRGASNSLYWFSVMGFSFFAVVFWVYWIGLDLSFPERLSKHLHKLQPGYDAHVRWLPLAVSIALCAAWIVLLRRLQRSLERPIVVWAAGITLLWGMANTLFLAYVDTGKSYRTMVASLAEALPRNYDCISSRTLGEPARAMLHYYADIITYRDEIPTRARSCSLLLHQGVRAQPPEIPPGWHQRWEGTRPGEKTEYFWLYAFGPPG